MNPLTNNHCSTRVPPTSVLFATILESIRDSEGNPVQLQAMLDSGFQAIFNTSDNPRALLLPTKKTKYYIDPTRCWYYKRVNQLLATKFNNSIDVNIIALPKIANHISQNKIDVL